MLLKQFSFITLAKIASMSRNTEFKLSSLGYILLLAAAMSMSFYCGSIYVEPTAIVQPSESTAIQSAAPVAGEPVVTGAEKYATPVVLQADANKIIHYDTLIALGDSITQRGYNPKTDGFLAHLANHYQRQMDIINRGQSGYNSFRALRAAKKFLPKTKPALAKRSAYSTALVKWITPVSSKSLWRNRTILPNNASKLQMLFICLGANDARLPSKSDSATLEQYKSNMRAIISLLRDPASEYYSPKTRILVITPPPVGELLVQSYIPSSVDNPIVFNNRTRLFAEMAKQVAREAGVPSIDLYSEIENRVREEQTTGKWSSTYDGYDNYLVDGVHLNNGGNMLLYKLILTKFKAVWPEMLPKSLP